MIQPLRVFRATGLRAGQPHLRGKPMRPSRLFLPLLVALGMAAAPATSFAQVSVGVSITVAPPALPVYVQPPIPGPGFIWTPGYWAYGRPAFTGVPAPGCRPPPWGCRGRPAIGV